MGRRGYQTKESGVPIQMSNQPRMGTLMIGDVNIETNGLYIICPMDCKGLERKLTF